MTTYHIHMSIETLLSYGDKRLGEIIYHPQGVDGARNELSSLRKMGVEFLTCDSECDNRKPDGSCAGHTNPGEKAFP